MVCYLAVPNHYLNQCWLLSHISVVFPWEQLSSETHLKLKSHQILNSNLAHNLYLICQIALKFYRGHSCNTAVFCAKFQSDLVIERNVMDELDFKKFDFKMSFGRICSRVDSRVASSQWETSLQSNAVPHWLAANLESALIWYTTTVPSDTERFPKGNPPHVSGGIYDLQAWSQWSVTCDCHGPVTQDENIAGCRPDDDPVA